MACTIVARGVAPVSTSVPRETTMPPGDARHRLGQVAGRRVALMIAFQEVGDAPAGQVLPRLRATTAPGNPHATTRFLAVVVRACASRTRRPRRRSGGKWLLPSESRWRRRNGSGPLPGPGYAELADRDDGRIQRRMRGSDGHRRTERRAAWLVRPHVH